MSKKKAGGKTAQHVRPSGKRLGIKVSSGERVKTGAILVRQSGKKFFPGENVSLGRDYTLFSLKNGIVKFGKKLGKKIVSVISN